VSLREKGKLLEKIFAPTTRDEVLVAVFRSRFIDDLCPRLRRLVGYVQLDQYHRLTADAHLLQAVREVRRLFLSPRQLGRLAFLKKDLQRKDLRILQWAALYHDLAKGLNEDHSEKGEEWVYQDLKGYGVEKEVIAEVAWLVKNHLALSQAAFRKNPQDPQTWEELFHQGTTDQRLRRLALFTAADIRATNGEAWNAWKSELLAKVVKNWLQGRTKNFLQVKTHLPARLRNLSLETWDLQLFEAFPSRTIAEDLQKLASEQKSGVRLFKDKAKKTWVRFYTPMDRPGLLLQYLSLLYSFGCSVQHALVHTAEGFGVYDWFQISSSRSPALLEKYLAMGLEAVPPPMPREVPQVQFMEIDLVSETSQEWVIGFRGNDQKGCLLAATARITGLGGEILSARVHTWGRQIDDLFHIRPRPEKSADFLTKIREKLL
jgi:[protein-PII] uridylyltransferase